MLPHNLIEAPTIRNEKSSIQLKEKLSEMSKIYYWFISKGGNFNAQNNFNSLQRPKQMSERKCRAVFLTNNKWSLTQHVQTFCLPLIWCENVNFVLLMKAQITRKCIKLYRSFYMHNARTRVGDALQEMFCYNSKRMKIYLGMKSVKLLLVLSIF